MVIRPDTPPDAAQTAIIAEQLGREPRGIEALAATDGQGTPLVLRMAPIVDGKPFPTLFWLSSELLKVELSRIEAAGVKMKTVMKRKNQKRKNQVKSRKRKRWKK